MEIIHSRTKIIATIGPASNQKEVLKEMILAGVDVCRVNFSHENHIVHAETIKTIRELNKELDTNVAILVDLQGPKIRIGEVEGEKIKLEKNDIVEFVTYDTKCSKDRFHVDYEDFAIDINPDEEILIDDGNIKLIVVETNKSDSVKARVIYGGLISSRKGVNLPQTKLSLPSMTDKDIEDAHFALENDVDWLALSFVRHVSDIIELKQLIKRKKKKVNVVAKIEKPQAIENLDEIIQEADAIMVARGDLGVELDFARVPLLQKTIVEKCLHYSKPVIIATQMMESMITNFRPTRAEANDVANAVLDGADTLMLSGETSVGEYPVLTIKSMHRIIQETEQKRYNYNRGVRPEDTSDRFIRDSICYSASRMAEKIGAKAIVTFTEHGNTAFTISGYRPKADIYAFTRHKSLLSVLSLLWGVRSFYFEKFDEINQAIDSSINILKAKGLVKSGDYIIHVASTPLKVTHKTNMLKVTKVE
ncbi:MAG: pyruvate kinase [Bacteroidales bacterium]|nr:pyruvate kinase [Bacteroidales bacterium]